MTRDIAESEQEALRSRVHDWFMFWIAPVLAVFGILVLLFGLMLELKAHYPLAAKVVATFLVLVMVLLVVVVVAGGAETEVES